MKKYLKVFIIFSFFTSLIACKNNNDIIKDVKKEFFGITLTEVTGGKITLKRKKDAKILKGSDLKQIEKDTELEATLEAEDGYKPSKLIIGKTEYKNVVNDKIIVSFKLTENTTIRAKLENIEKLTLTIASDAKANIASPTMTVHKNSKWQDVKSKITITYHEGWTLEGWHFDNKNGALIGDNYIFTENKTVFACTKKIGKNFKIKVTQPENGKITVKKVVSVGNEVELSSPELLSVLENTNLKVELTSNDIVKYTPFELKIGDKSFTTVQENKITHYFSITEDVAISASLKAFFKVTKKEVANGAITVQREHGGTLTPVFDAELNKVIEGKELIIKLSANATYKVKSLTITKEKAGNSEVITNVNEEGKIEKKITVDDNITLEGEVEVDPSTQPLNKIEIDISGVKFKMVNIPELTTPTKLCGQEGVTISSYQLSETEVTQALYQKVMGKNPTTTAPAEHNEKPKCPVSQVTWYDAVAFCNELTILNDGNETKNCMYYTDEQKTHIYRREDAEAKKYPYVAWQKKGFRLPTEAEWEAGAFGGEAKQYPGSDTPASVAWFDETSFSSIHHNVATKGANAYGLHDMAGNVAEWVWDPYVESDVRKNNPTSKNPTYKHKKATNGSCDGAATIRGGDYTCFSSFVTTPLMCNARDESTCKIPYDSIDGIDIGIRIARGAFKVPVKVFKLTVGTYELTKEELEDARKDSGFTKVFEKGSANVQILVEAESGSTTSFEVGNSPLTLTENSQKVVVRVSKEEFVDQVFTLFLSKRVEGGSSEIVNGTKKDYQIGNTGVSFKMVSIASVDDVTLGSTDKKDNQPHKVSLSAYQISETEITQKVYEIVTGKNPSYFTESKKVVGDNQELRPVDQVLWYEAVAFCNMLTSQVKGNNDECVYYNNEALTEVYTMEHAKRDIQAVNVQGGSIPQTPYVAWDKKGFRLPTEAEWEWASMGGENGKYSGSNDLLAVAWCGDNATNIGGDYVTREVAKKQANGYGLYDMTGNVFEWCGEWRVNDTTPQGGKDPKGQQISGGSKYKVQRSSSYGLSVHEKHESTHRDWQDIFSRSKTSGIRLVSRLF